MSADTVLLDIDGTITARDGAISPELVALLHQARAAGIAVACATARTCAAARIRLGPLGWIAGEGVFHNGGLVLVQGRVAWAAEMPPDVVAAAVAAARDADPAVVIAIHAARDAPAFSTAYDDRLLALWGVTAAELRPFARGLAEPAVKLGMWLPSEAPRSIGAVHAAVAAAVGAVATVCAADEERFVFLTAKGIDKAAGAGAWLRARDRDPARAIAVGDDCTDAPLLALCGQGIAIAGGHPAALAAAGCAVRPPPDPGLAAELARRLGPIPPRS